MTSEWTCPHCGEEEHESMLVMNDEIEVDVTCQNVYFTFNDNSHDPGMVFGHDTFERIIDHYNSANEGDFE